jgi:hypothetical protein
MRTTSTTERAAPPPAFAGLARHVRVDARLGGTLACALGLALLVWPSLLATAIGVELLALAFWIWSRAAPDAAAQVSRWGWLRRPATALWLAYAIGAAFPVLESGPQSRTLEFLRAVQGAAIVWGGLELLAALPLARTFSDLPGPFLEVRSWLPVLLPATGFVVLWRHAALWNAFPFVRRTALVLLLVTAVLAVLRAFVRRQWTATLRWLVVVDCALAAMLLAGPALAPDATLLLWVAACGGHAFLLAGELRGSAPRRGMLLVRLWRAASWTALACLAWPAAAVHGPAKLGALGVALRVGLAFTTALAGWLVIGRLRPADERRRVMRPGSPVTVSHVVAAGILAIGPTALLRAWWAGFTPSFESTLAALGPVVVGGWAAVMSRQRPPVRHALQRVIEGMRTPAKLAFDLVVRLERLLVGWLERLAGALARPLHELHSGDAQEYLLFLVGLALVAVVLPLLR